HVTFSMSGEDCLGVLSGRLDGPSVFMSGRLRVSGDLGLAIQLKTLFPSVH
ncbi:MAG: SCP2 sterol-binding domain-containing protein, partial [Nitrospirae bacterium]|nr:SCP2 sterol-binding domain-containing protein [Nitrospirota bacterium]